jgi:hypothetical protein
VSEATEGIVARLRNYDACHDGDIDQAADMLDFFFASMQVCQPSKDGNHYWRFAPGWPLSSVNGKTPEEAVAKAMELVKQQGGLT